MTIQEWATIMVGMLFLDSIQLICIEIMVEYITRIFHETKQRPMTIIDKIYSTCRRTIDLKQSPKKSFF